MNLNRREFLTVSAVTGVVGAVAPSAEAFTLPDPPQKGRLRLSSQEGVAPGKSLTEKLDFLEAQGFEGFEPAGRKMPGEDEGDNYVEAFKGLRLIGYQESVSLECGCKGDPTKAIPAAVKLLREQWEAAAG